MNIERSFSSHQNRLHQELDTISENTNTQRFQLMCDLSDTYNKLCTESV
jgi:hypothetical protein